VRRERGLGGRKKVIKSAVANVGNEKKLGGKRIDMPNPLNGTALRASQFFFLLDGVEEGELQDREGSWGNRKGIS